MKILFDIGHPGHVHYFKNYIQFLKENDSEVLIIAREKEVSLDLLHAYSLNYINRGKGGKGIIGKALYLIKANLLIFFHSMRFKPDFIISFGSPYLALVSLFLPVKIITLDDTEVGKFEQLFYKLYSNLIITPNVFLKNLGKKHVRFDGYMELAYLKEKYFTPNPKVLTKYDLKPDQNYTIVRFVSWNASHDKGEKGLSITEKEQIINICSANSKILISSEGKLPPKLDKYKAQIAPEDLHNLLYYAKLYLGEGATTASECAMMGTPAIYINSINAGTLIEQEKEGLLYNFRGFQGVVNKIQEILTTKDIKNLQREKSKLIVNQKADTNSLLKWLLSDYKKNRELLLQNKANKSMFN